MRIEDINEIEVDPLLNNRTKCTKMTDEKSSTIKNGINGASTNNNTTEINVNNRDNSNATSSTTSATSAVTTAAAAAVVAAITTTISSGIYGGNNNNNNNISNNSNGIQHQQQHQSILSSTDGSGCINLKKDTENLDTDNHNNHHHPNHNRLQDNHKINKYNNDIIVGGGGGGGGSQLINNGSGDNNNSSIRASHQQQGIGGRLQFFKDGKFILELARAREGEKSGWVSVPRKTFWPPSIQSANTTAVNYATKNESSASLSFSDDNSSIQSSPWQRDHCWKQTTPKKCISREMCMMFKRLKNYKLSNDGYKIAKIKRRRPYDTTMCKIPFTTTYLENGYIGRFNDDVIEDNDDDDDGLNKKQNKNNEKYNDNCSKNYGILDCRNNKKTVDEKKLKKSHTSQNVKLTTILQKLIDRLPTGVFSLPKTTHSSGTINHFSSSTSSRIADYHHHQHVSPRKRILRELEKVTLEDNKRSRAKAGNVTSLSPLITTSTSMCHNTTNKPTSNTSNVQTSSANDSLNDHHHHHNTNSGSTNSSTRLYSSYSIHSLLGHTTTNNSNHKNDSSSIVNSSTKEINNDPSYLRNVLSSPKSPENGGHHHYHNNDLVTSSSSSSLSSVMNNKKKSPTYASLQDVHRHNRSPSSEALTNYGRVRSPEENRSPDSQLSNRYKQQFGSPISASTTLSGFHPYLASPKYSSNNQQSTNLVAENNYKMKTLCTSNSPNHTRNTGCSRSPSAFSPSPQNKLSSFHSPTSSSTNNNCNRLREPSPSDTVSPGLERREAIPRTVPKKTVALRQQFSSPVSSPSVTQGDTSSSSTYKSGIDQKRKNIDDRTLSPDNNAIYHSGVDMEHVTAGVLRSSPVLPHSSLFYLYPPHGSPGSHSAAAAAAAAAAASSYIPPVPYYHPYAAAVAALRHPLWMHYQAGVMSSVNMQPNRLPTSIFPYNGTAGTVSASSIPSSLASMHLSPPPTAAINPWSPLSRESSVTEDPVSLVSIKDEHSSDVPLNLSKH